MSAILSAPFGNPEAAHKAAAANATFNRALKLGYGPNTANALARQAKVEATDLESAAETAFRLVRTPHMSATVRDP